MSVHKVKTINARFFLLHTLKQFKKFYMNKNIDARKTLENYYLTMDNIFFRETMDSIIYGYIMCGLQFNHDSPCIRLQK